jgi:hypothetical protein
MENDHDSITRMDEQLRGLARDRDGMLTRISTTEGTLNAIQLSHALSKGQLIGVSATISAVSGVLIKLFW